MATGVLDELLVGLGFDFDEKEAKKFKKSIDQVSVSIQKLTRKALAAAAAFGFYTLKTNQAAAGLEKTSGVLNTTVERLDSLAGAAAEATGTSDGLTASLKSLQVAASAASRGEGPIESFGRLGLEVLDVNGNLKDTVDLFLEASSAITALPMAQQLDFAQQIGLGGQILTLQRGREGIEELMASTTQLGVTTNGVAKNAKAFEEAFRRLTRTARVFGQTLFKDVTPWLTEMFDKLSQTLVVMRDNIRPELDRIVEAFGGWGRVLQLVGLALGALFLPKIIRIFTSLGAAIAASAGPLKLLSRLLLAFINPWALLGFAIALVAEDLFKFLNGGGSLLGELIEEFPDLGVVVEALGVVFTALGGIVGSVLEGIKLLAGDTAEVFMEVFEGPIDQVKEWMGELWDVIIENLSSDVWKESVEAFTESFGEGIKDAIRDLPNTLREAFTFSPGALLFGKAKEKYDELQAAEQERRNKPGGFNERMGLGDFVNGVQMPLAGPGASLGGSSVGNRGNTSTSTTTNHNTFHVDTIMNPEELTAWYENIVRGQNEHADTKIRNPVGV